MAGNLIPTPVNIEDQLKSMKIIQNGIDLKPGETRTITLVSEPVSEGMEVSAIVVDQPTATSNYSIVGQGQSQQAFQDSTGTTKRVSSMSLTLLGAQNMEGKDKTSKLTFHMPDKKEIPIRVVS